MRDQGTGGRSHQETPTGGLGRPEGTLHGGSQSQHQALYKPGRIVLSVSSLLCVRRDHRLGAVRIQSVNTSRVLLAPGLAQSESQLRVSCYDKHTSGPSTGSGCGYLYCGFQEFVCFEEVAPRRGAQGPPGASVTKLRPTSGPPVSVLGMLHTLDFYRFLRITGSQTWAPCFQLSPRCCNC